MCITLQVALGKHPIEVMDLQKAETVVATEITLAEKVQKLLQENETLQNIIKDLNAKMETLTGDDILGKMKTALDDAGKKAEEALGFRPKSSPPKKGK